jgi:hypothetical protein
MPQPADVPQTTHAYLVEAAVPLLFSPPREILHVPLAALTVA